MSNAIVLTEAVELFDACETALAIAGLPEFKSVESPDQSEMLRFLSPDNEDEEATWALVPAAGPLEDYVALDTGMARQLVEAHFRNWLLARGYQVQVHCRKAARRWKLADCLSVADGGGDRLDVDYPQGDDELSVLAASVIAVNTLR